MAAAALQGTDIRRILTEAGPVVKCVLLRHMAPSGKDEHPSLAAAAPGPADGADAPQPQHHRPVLAHMIEEVELDTTPSKSQVRHVLGGPWTFLGQYEEEGIVVMMRQPLPENDDDDDDSGSEDEEEPGEEETKRGKPKKDDTPDIFEAFTVAQLKTICQDYFIPLPASDSGDDKEQKQRLVEALQQARENMASQVNPHRLQPPFDDIVVHGDLLLLRVAKTDEILDTGKEDEEEEGGDDEGNQTSKDLSVLSNDEFFQDYTKDEYIKFASRTDIVAPELPEHEDDDESEEDDDLEDEEAFELGDDEDEEFDEGEREGLLNLLMNELLRKFREENGRGPNTEELLELRSAVAEKLGVQVATVPHEKDDDNDKKRSADNDGSGTPSKRVKFSSLDEDGKDEAAGAEAGKSGKVDAAEDVTASKEE